MQCSTEPTHTCRSTGRDPVYERSRHPLRTRSRSARSLVTHVHIVASALGKPSASLPRSTSARAKKRVSRSEPLGRRVVRRGKPVVAQPRHPSEPSVRAEASDPQRDRSVGRARRQLIKPDPGSRQWPSPIPSIRVPRACCGRVASTSASSPRRQSRPDCRPARGPVAGPAWPLQAAASTVQCTTALNR